MAVSTSLATQGHASKTMSLNMKLIAHHELGGFGGIGEGINMQAANDGRRILWLAHEAAPKNFTGIDVTDPRSPKVVVQRDQPHNKVRANSLDVVGDLMAVACQTKEKGMQPAGFDLFDISTPEDPKLISHFDAAGPHSIGAHCLWFVDGEYVHASMGAADFTPRHERDHQIYRIIDVRNPSKPVEAGRWWYPGAREDDPEPPMRRHPKFDSGFRAHNTSVYPARPDRAYVGYIEGGVVVLDISDKAHPKEISRFCNSPPYNGMMHTVMPLLERNLLVLTEEASISKYNNLYRSGMMWIVDAREEKNLISIATLPLPPEEAFAKRGGRFGPHNIHENYPGPCSFRSEEIIVGTFFNAGVRVFDISNQYQPREIAYFVPGAPPLSPAGAIQMNDVFVDDRGIVYAVDRLVGGLYILEMNI